MSSDYMKSLKSPKMLAAYAINMGLAPTHSEKCGSSPKYVFQLSSQKFVQAHDI
jgi:hypothetical protein